MRKLFGNLDSGFSSDREFCLFFPAAPDRKEDSFRSGPIARGLRMKVPSKSWWDIIRLSRANNLKAPGQKALSFVGGELRSLCDASIYRYQRGQNSTIMSPAIDFPRVSGQNYRGGIQGSSPFPPPRSPLLATGSWSAALRRLVG